MSISLFAKLYNRFGHKPSSDEDMQKVAAKLRSELPALPDGARHQIERGSHVAVVGAGLAGLAASYYLTREGYSVTLFEARNVLGGRVETANDFIPGRLIEAGAELIGTNHLMWMQLAQRFELSLMVVSKEEHFTGALLDMPMRLDGQDIDSRRQEWLYKELNQAYSDLNGDAAKIQFADQPWDIDGGNSALANQFDGQSVGYWLVDWLARQSYADPDDLQLVRTALQHNLENDQTIPVSEQSLLGLLAAVKGGALSDDLASRTEPSEYWTHSEVFRCASGNESLAHALAVHCIRTSRFDFRQGSPVRAMYPSDHEVTVHSGDPRALTKEQFDMVVVAVPTTVVGHIAGINVPTIAAGPAVKHLSRVKKRFWLEHSKAPSGIHEEIGSFWEGSDNQVDSGGADFDVSLFSGCHAARNVLGLSQVALNNTLEQSCPGYKNALQYNRFVDWTAEQWIEAGYSCPALHQVTNQAKALFNGQERVVFAGEHTCMSHFGYMEGALQSGFRAARQIIDGYVRV